jgi:hypothetical protein
LAAALTGLVLAVPERAGNIVRKAEEN